MSISLYGEDTTTLLALGEEAVRRLRTIPGLLSVDTDLERGGQELQIQLDRDRARRLGINPQAISSTIGTAMRGLELGRFLARDGRELRIYAQLGEADRARLDDVRGMTFRTDTGIEVPLESLAGLICLGQLVRLVARITFVVAGHPVPFWMSAVAVLVAGSRARRRCAGRARCRLRTGRRAGRFSCARRRIIALRARQAPAT